MTEQDVTTRVPPEDKPKRRIGRIFFWALFGIAAVLLVASIAIPFVTIQVYPVSTTTMENTIFPGDRVLVTSGGIRRGDVIVLRRPVAGSGPSDLFVKRVIGLPGDHVACCDARGRVTVDGKPLDESYLYPGDPPSMIRFSVTLGRGRIWVMGDRRNISLDSREWGQVAASDVVGRVVSVNHGFSFAWTHTPQTFVTDGLAPADRRSDTYVGMGFAAGISALMLLVLAVVGISRAVIRSRPSPEAAKPPPTSYAGPRS